MRKFKHPTKRTDLFSAESRDQHQNVGDVGNRTVPANVRTIVTYRYRCRTASITLKLSIQLCKTKDLSALHSLLNPSRSIYRHLAALYTLHRRLNPMRQCTNAPTPNPPPLYRDNQSRLSENKIRLPWNKIRPPPLNSPSQLPPQSSGVTPTAACSIPPHPIPSQAIPFHPHPHPPAIEAFVLTLHRDH